MQIDINETGPGNSLKASLRSSVGTICDANMRSDRCLVHAAVPLQILGHEF